MPWLFKNRGAPVSGGDTVKASAGAIFSIPICKVDHIKDAIFLPPKFRSQCNWATEKLQKTIYQTSLEGPFGLVMGSEGKGISKSVLALLDDQASSHYVEK